MRLRDPFLVTQVFPYDFQVVNSSSLLYARYEGKYERKKDFTFVLLLLLKKPFAPKLVHERSILEVRIAKFETYRGTSFPRNKSNLTSP